MIKLCELLYYVVAVGHHDNNQKACDSRITNAEVKFDDQKTSAFEVGGGQRRK